MGFTNTTVWLDVYKYTYLNLFEKELAISFRVRRKKQGPLSCPAA